MAVRSLASITVAFGLVSIPVRLYTATESAKAISFNLLHKGCGSRLKQQYICEREGVVVSRDDMVKGYEFSKDNYVTFTGDELKALEEIGTKTADISEFVPISAVDPVYFDKAYYLAPDKFGAKPYALLQTALRESERCAIGRWAVRGKQYIVMIRPYGDGLVMQQLLYDREVRSIDELEIPKTPVSEKELQLAKMLIDQQSTDTFDPSAFPDTVTARIESAIEEKVAGKEISVAAPAAATGQVIDLMDALRASLAAKPAKAGKANAQKAALLTPAAGKDEEAKTAETSRKGPRRAPPEDQPLPAELPARKTTRKKA